DRSSARESPCRAPPTSRAGTARPSLAVDGVSRSAPRARPAPRRGRGRTPRRERRPCRNRDRGRAPSSGPEHNLGEMLVASADGLEHPWQVAKRQIMRDHEIPFQRAVGKRGETHGPFLTRKRGAEGVPGAVQRHFLAEKVLEGLVLKR